ncbi:putative proline--tRNA ligase C19C7.06 isoform X2 [Chenopodium quinoa]|uniref:putative proline--tRNA ligase C19C7.06 isoform X2 n=1 Tax=Chenopodium quinoa TaxID=63459 RepID=UPI000B771263|nr:putative proline--tRNA ligase C19C7.06 isoform X2 [Chenopodium quinoa]XP_021751661.1 putative proline--tRNA ligase C19C7.06 isoform X2 [Chenopodium quinoa]
MGYTKEQLLELQIEFEKYEHPVVLTVEAALKYLANVDGAFCKNLFLKDKKHRYYIISALAETKVDMKVLSVRLGLGKGGLRMAPEEALGEVLQVPLGCVTPFAVVNESARHVSLLLDQGLRTQRRIMFHPLSNDMSIALSTDGLDKFLKSLGREPAYVDLEANPPVGKDQPPDLAAFAPSNAIAVPEAAAKAASTEPAPQKSQPANSDLVTGNPVKKPAAEKIVKNMPAKGKTANAAASTPFSNPQLFVDEILDRTSALILSEINKETISTHGEQLGAVASDNIRKRLSSELSHLAMLYKSTAYTEGFHAGSHRHESHL